MEKYVLKQIEVQAVQWDGTNETYEKLMQSSISGKIQQYVQPAQTLTIQDPKNSRGVIIQKGIWIVVYEDGTYSLFDDANFNAKFETASTVAMNNLP